MTIRHLYQLLAALEDVPDSRTVTVSDSSLSVRCASSEEAALVADRAAIRGLEFEQETDTLVRIRRRDW